MRVLLVVGGLYSAETRIGRCVRAVWRLSRGTLDDFASAHPAVCAACDSAAELLRRFEIAAPWCDVGAFVAVGLGHRAEIAAKPVEVVGASGRRAPAGVEAEADPVHAVLGGQDRERDERVELVAVDALRVGEAGCELVLPAHAVGPRPRGALSERLEAGGWGPHVGG